MYGRVAAIALALVGVACGVPGYGPETSYVRIERLDSKYFPGPRDDTYRVVLGPKESRQIATEATERKKAENLSNDAFMELWRDYARKMAIAELRRRGLCAGAAELQGRIGGVDHSQDTQVVIYCPRAK